MALQSGQLARIRATVTDSRRHKPEEYFLASVEDLFSGETLRESQAQTHTDAEYKLRWLLEEETDCDT